MKNIHLIPTDKPSRLWTNNLRRRLELDEFPERHPTNIAKHIYITNDEEIKEGDWFIYRCYKLCKCTGLSQSKQILTDNEIAKHKDLKIHMEIAEDYYVLADEYALQTIFRNLLDNSKKHRPQPQQAITIEAKDDSKNVKLIYNDHGSPFNGDMKMLGELFYKYNSSQGTGIGIYIIKRLTQAMQGKLTISNSPNLIFQITLPLSSAGQAI
jgi:signal transduction histidine kinase